MPDRGLLMFLLVTFVLLGMSLTKVGNVDVKIPVGFGGRDGHPLIIQVSGSGKVFIDRMPYDISELPKMLKSYRETCAEAGDDPSVLISGDDRARYGMLVQAIDCVKSAGIEHMVVETNYRATGK